MKQKQVNSTHYRFEKYITKNRWISIWHQIDEISKLKPESVLEIGPGSGILKFILTKNGINIQTVDIDDELNPDYVASATKLPFDNNTYDCVCSFQALEHLPYEESLKAFGEMVRVAKQTIIISLPNSKILWPYVIYIPRLGKFNINIPKLLYGPIEHKFDGEHYWEINKKGYAFKKICNDFSSFNIKMLYNYRVNEHPYHHFFVFEKVNN